MDWGRFAENWNFGRLIHRFVIDVQRSSAKRLFLVNLHGAWQNDRSFISNYRPSKGDAKLHIDGCARCLKMVSQMVQRTAPQRFLYCRAACLTAIVSIRRSRELSLTTFDTQSHSVSSSASSPLHFFCAFNRGTPSSPSGLSIRTCGSDSASALYLCFSPWMIGFGHLDSISWGRFKLKHLQILELDIRSRDLLRDCI